MEFIHTGQINSIYTDHAMDIMRVFYETVELIRNHACHTIINLVRIMKEKQRFVDNSENWILIIHMDFNMDLVLVFNVMLFWEYMIFIHCAYIFHNYTMQLRGWPCNIHDL